MGAYEDNGPAEVFPLAQYLGEEMVERGWASADVAARMGDEREYAVNALIVEFILAGANERGVNIDEGTFKALALAFGTSSELWRNLHATWLKWPDRRAKYEAPDHLFIGTFKAPADGGGRT